MANVFVREDSDDFIQVPTGDEVFVMRDVDFTAAISSASGEDDQAKVHVDGAVVNGGNSTINLFGTGTGERDGRGRHLITVGADGLVRGDFRAISMQGGENRLHNYGQIIGLFESILNLGEGAEITNAGIVLGSVKVGSHYFDVDISEINTVRNTGSIEGQFAVQSSVSPLHLENDGYMAALEGDFSHAVRIDEAVGESFVRNSGVITGQLSSLQVRDSDQRVTVINDGRMVGDVLFDAGDDLYRGVAEGAVVGAVRGAAGADSLLGAALDDELHGDDGADLLRGRAGQDALYGGEGEDELRGGADDDRLFGGTENDLLIGASGDDSLDGGEGEDDLRGGRDDDVLDGGSENDQLRGGRGDDVLTGGEGSDELRGGRDDDVLDGGAGSDRAHGGAGADLFVWTAGTADGSDRVLGFDGNDGDRLDFTGAGTNGRVRLVDSFAAGDGFEGVEAVVVRGRVRIDIDDDGARDHVVRVFDASGRLASLDAGDFVL